MVSAQSMMAEIERQRAIEERWARLSELIGSADGKKFRNYAQQFTLDELPGYANTHLAQLARRSDPAAGYDPLLSEMIGPVLQDCVRDGIRIVGNFGAANPRGAARRIRDLAMEQGGPPPRIAVVIGDDLSGPAHRQALLQHLGDAATDIDIASANAYLGAEAIAQALQAGADVVVTGRVADPSLTVGPAMAHFGWAPDDWDHLAAATMAGHLLECGAQVCGGYYADPGYKEVPDLAHVVRVTAPRSNRVEFIEQVDPAGLSDLIEQQPELASRLTEEPAKQ